MLVYMRSIHVVYTLEKKFQIDFSSLTTNTSMKRDRCEKCNRAKRGPRFCGYHTPKCGGCGKKSSTTPCRICKFSQFKKSLSHWKKNPELVTPTTRILDDIAILGGHFQGDGCIHSSQRMISVISVNEDVVLLFQKSFGGSVKYDCGAYRWRLCGKNQVVFALGLIKPYVWNKEEQLDMMCSTETIDEVFVNNMKTLKQTPPTNLIEKALALTQENVYKVIAGFLGADGMVTLSLPKCSATVDFGQKYRDILDVIAHFFPGPKVLGPYTSYRNDTKCTSYRIRYRGIYAIKLLEKIYQYISCSYKVEIARTILDNRENLRDEKVVKRVFGLIENGKSKQIKRNIAI